MRPEERRSAGRAPKQFPPEVRILAIVSDTPAAIGRVDKDRLQALAKKGIAALP